ncbi:MAG: lysogenization regulator HflD [Zetaproteobacteria bacterium CG_4_9_14_3_um_filter_49_83]|nr:MAG: lysogenization regulator HflD [Zetaproteobacteria bacterium CG1_02_49_23]PIQ33933.1 MAG: lysogenization regulator HflD [Zetaproteobacteria bacterium CG17_big_fil_post_rev_8_21_14_2_50_50_13]PIV30174.1 MAG: lysogenization regulator HflD [Zetaproteobacteria bacterium CG02_land_8_20_14_3_00_50_9]PIY54864.1 MAG: lysogenization regulator HflD [Zetaproteobacteria bacterium CG_4_10_14_0_8_um_filter_49_80]PJA35210.1 MAG: lysogenization regulator HflD [Zetaproteobacteria bacterium CG_4_9_14_3_um
MLESHLNHPLSQHEQRVLALAGVMQAVRLVDHIARKGMCDAEDFQVCINSIFAEPKGILSMYGNINALKTGLHVTHQILGGHKTQQAKPMLSYAAGLMALDKKLSKQPETLAILAAHMNRIHRQVDYFGSATHENIISSIAHAYGESISTMQPRIIVRGKTDFLSQAHHTQKVRALLLSGLRAAHQWHQLGGSHLHLLFRRKQLAHASQTLMHLEITPQETLNSDR